jgi:hypothetical protein
VPLHALATAAVDAAFSPYASFADLPQLLEQRLPVEILIYSGWAPSGPPWSCAGAPTTTPGGRRRSSRRWSWRASG